MPVAVVPAAKTPYAVVSVATPVPPAVTGTVVVNPAVSASHDAAVVPEVNIHVITAVVLAVTVTTAFRPED